MSTPAAPAVRLESATVRFVSERGAVTALEKVSVDIPAGGFVTLLGHPDAASPRCSAWWPTWWPRRKGR
jgi:hypothetical protein